MECDSIYAICKDLSCSFYIDTSMCMHAAQNASGIEKKCAPQNNLYIIPCPHAIARHEGVTFNPMLIQVSTNDAAIITITFFSPGPLVTPDQAFIAHA
jgi:hypothetical protein